MNKMLPFLTLLPLFGFWTNTSATMASSNKPLPIPLRAGVNNENKKLKLDDVIHEGGAEKVQTASIVEQQNSFLTKNKKENGESVSRLSTGRHLQASRLSPRIRQRFLRGVEIYAEAFIQLVQGREIGRVTHTGTVRRGFRGRNRLPRGAILSFRTARPITIAAIRRVLSFLSDNDDDDFLEVRQIFLLGSVTGPGSRRTRNVRVMVRFDIAFLESSRFFQCRTRNRVCRGVPAELLLG